MATDPCHHPHPPKEKSQDALTSDKWEPARWAKEAWILEGHGIGVWTKFNQISWKWQRAGAGGNGWTRMIGVKVKKNGVSLYFEGIFDGLNKGLRKKDEIQV